MTPAALWNLAQEGASLLILIGTPIIAWLLWCLRREFVKREECERCRKEISDRQTALESLQGVDAGRRESLAQTMRDMPTSKDFSEIRLAMKDLAGDLRTMQAQIQGQADILKIVKEQGDTLHNYILTKGL